MNLNITKWIGIILFSVGTLMATISASKVPTAGHTYPDTLGTFVIGTIISLIGVILWHIINKKIIKEKIQNKDLTNDSENPLKLMEKMQPELKKLDDKFQSLSLEDIIIEVDKILDNYILPIANIREDITNILGMSKGSTVLLTLAYGERNLNRVWSAAADNHIEEARKSYPQASQALKQAWEETH